MPSLVEHDPAEIKKWKALIYGQNNNGTKVDEWAGVAQDSRKSGRRKSGKKPAWK